MLKKIKIENRVVGEGRRCFIVAEIGSNHNRDKGIVRKLIDAAASAGFDAVKFQLYNATETFRKDVTTDDIGLMQMYGKNKAWWKIACDKILMPRDWFSEMFAYARRKKLIPFSTVHHLEDVDFLLNLGSSVFKIASLDCYHLSLIQHVASLNKPLIVSTGMSYLKEIDGMVTTVKGAGNNKLILLHCVSCYPPHPKAINLKNITMLRKRYGYPVGFSDHAISNIFSLAALSLGACVLEKHITLDRKMKGPDHPFALEPKDMQELVKSVREVEDALGRQERVLSKDELRARRMSRKSIVAKVDIRKGSPLSIDMVKFSRPGAGLLPHLFKDIVGRKVKQDIPVETEISLKMLR